MPKTRNKPRDRLTLRNPWLWVVIGIVALVVMFVLTGVMAKPQPPPARAAVLSARDEDLLAFTRMLDTVALEPEYLAGLSPELQRELAKADSMIGTGSARDAFARIKKLAKKADAGSRRLLHAFTGLYRSRLREYSDAVLAFEEALAPADSACPGLTARLCFNVGYLFQRFGKPDSAACYYGRSAELLAAGPDRPAPPFLSALLNNRGVAGEALADTTAARQYYRQAAALIDTTDTGRDARVVRENVARLGPAPD